MLSNPNWSYKTLVITGLRSEIPGEMWRFLEDMKPSPTKSQNLQKSSIFSGYPVHTYADRKTGTSRCQKLNLQIHIFFSSTGTGHSFSKITSQPRGSGIFASYQSKFPHLHHCGQEILRMNRDLRFESKKTYENLTVWLNFLELCSRHVKFNFC